MHITPRTGTRRPARPCGGKVTKSGAASGHSVRMAFIISSGFSPGFCARMTTSSAMVSRRPSQVYFAISGMMSTSTWPDFAFLTS